MKKIKNQLKTIAKSLLSLSNKVEKIAERADALMPVKPAPSAKKAPAKKAPAKKAPTKKAAAKKAPKKKAAAKKAPTKKAAAKKAPAKKAAAKKKPRAAKAAPSKQSTVLDSVFGAIESAQNGITVAELKKGMDLNAKQLSNALYKLAKKGKIEAKSRGLYFKK